MGWTLTSLAAKAGKALGARQRWSDPYAVSHAAGRAQRGPGAGADTIFSRVYGYRLARASMADRKALEAARAQMGDDARVLERVAAAGAPVSAVAAFASAWDKLSASDQSLVRNPLGRDGTGPVTWGRTRAVQVDGTTCGAAAISVMTAIGDPLVALWLVTGRDMAGYVPPEVRAIAHRPGTLRSVKSRWEALQRAVHHAATRQGLGILPWPSALGTPPWGASKVTRIAGLKLRGVMVDDSDSREVRALIAHASASLRDGIPVLLYSSGHSRMGLETVVPRHVVLLTSRTDRGFRVYEPGSGAIHELRDDQIGSGEERLAALGHWARVSWLVLPSPRER
jgi:hypothetical protein